MTAEPLRSALSYGAAEDTSLALPSDNKLRLGQQRVLDQVHHTIKRSKSRQSKNGNLSPTSPVSVLSEFQTFKFSPTQLNGSVFRRSHSTKAVGQTKMATQQQQARTLSMKTVARRQVKSTSHWEQNFATSNWSTLPTNGLKPSGSDPALAQGQMKGKSATIHRQASNNFIARESSQVVNSSQMVRSLSNKSQAESKISVTKSKIDPPRSEGGGGVPDITMKEAVEYLSSDSENYQLCGASFIQHTTFKEEHAKGEVLQLGGIPALVGLLGSSNEQLQQTVAGALRNVVFKVTENKLEVEKCGGIKQALTLLKNTNSTETQKQLTGLLWNLSSEDKLKPELIKSALPVLTESIVVPFTCWSDESANNNIDPEVFHSATGCMRNLSCANVEERQAMRECRGLIDSLNTYVQSCVAVDEPDDKSVENCVCILHNLTYHLEAEAPEHFANFTSQGEPKSSSGRKSPTLGCFSPKSSKIQEQVFDFPAMEDAEPKGIGWLYHSKTMQTYLSLLGCSQKDSTLEACCGALQNLTAIKGTVSSLMSQSIVQKLHGLPHIAPMLQSPTPSLQRTAMSLVGNLSRTPTLQKTMARQVLPEVATLLSAGPKEMGNSDETMATACHTARTLLLAEPEIGRKVLNAGLVTSLSLLSENGYYPKASKAASLLLYSLWSEKDIQSFLKKQGLNKGTFVNDNTTAAHKSVQVVE